MLVTHGFAIQGVPQYALYLLNRLYVKEVTMAELKALAAYVIVETASQDGKVGGPVQMATITPDDGCAILGRPAVEEIVDANAARSEQLRRSFFANAG
jgi:20S proteasome alpha/beta subunit